MLLLAFSALPGLASPNPEQADRSLDQVDRRPAGHASAVGLTHGEKAWLASHPVIRVGMDPGYAPYDWIDRHGQHAGIAADYLRQLEKLLPVRFEIVKGKAWAEAIDMAKRGEVDLLTSIVMTPERSSFLTFTEPYRDIQTVIIDRGQGGFIGSLERLAGQRVAVEEGYFTRELLAKDHPQIQLVMARNTPEALRLLMDGKADAYVGDLGATNHAIRKMGLTSLRFSGQTEYLSQHRFAVSNTSKELAPILTKALAAIPKDEADAIFNRWLGLRIEQGIPAATLLRYGAAIALLFLLFGYWVYRLRRENAYRKAAEMRELSRNQVLEKLAKGAPLTEVLETIVHSVEQENTGMLCSIMLLDSQGTHLGRAVAPSLPAFFNAAMDGLEIGIGAGSCGMAAFAGNRVIVDNMATHAYWTSYKELAARAGLGSCWAQPIDSASGQVLGTFAIYQHAARAPTQADMATLEQSARMAGIAIEKSIAAEKHRESEALYRLLIEDASDVIWRSDRELRMTYISPADERLRGYRADEVIGHHVFEMFTHEGIAAVKKMLAQKPKIAPNGAEIGFVTFEAQHRCKDGRLLWAEVLSKPDYDARGTLIGFHGITREITERKQMQDQVRQLAFYDPLTKLPNRRLLNDRLAKAMSASRRSASYGAAMILDLDNFKSLNDTQGHLVGDLLLIEAARRLTSCVREMDTVARFGGDEFVVMLSDLNTDKPESTAQAGIVAEKIRISLSAPYLLIVSHDAKADTTVEHHCSASIGVVVFNGNEASQDDVLKWADVAMYQAKDAGRNCIRVYEAAV